MANPLDASTYNWLNSGSSNLFPGSAPFPGPAFPGLGFTAGRPPSGPGEALMQSLMPMVSEYLRQNLGMHSFNFGGERSAYDAAQSREYLHGLMQARQAAVPTDVNRLEGILRGTYSLFGGELDARHGQMIRRMAERGGEFLPLLAAVMPDAVDSAFGTVGSRVVAAGNFYSAGRYLTNEEGRVRRIDTGAFTAATLDRLYGTGAEGDPFTAERTAGLGAGRMSAAFDELSRRGAIGGFSGDAKAMGRQAADQLERYAEAIAVVRDIFGDVGRPNAPMQELVRGLDTITRGGVGTMDPARLAQQASQFRAAVRLSPLGYEGLAQFQELGGQLGQAYGLMPGQTAEAWRTGFLSSQAYGSLYAGTTGPELMNRQQFAAERMRLQAAGQASAYGNLIGAVAGLNRYVDPTSPLGRLNAAMTAGQSAVEIDGRTYDLRQMQVTEIEDLAVASGLERGAVTEQLQFTKSNQARRVDDPRLAEIDRQGQLAELTRTVEIGLANRGLGDARSLAADFVAAAQERGVRGIDDAVALVGDRRGLSAAQRVQLAAGVRQAGLVTDPANDLAAFQRLRVIGDRAAAAEAGAAADLTGEQATMLAQMSQARGGMVAGGADYLYNRGRVSPDVAGVLGGGAMAGAYGRPLTPSEEIIAFGKAIAGGVSAEENQRALAAQAAQAGRGPLGVPGAPAEVKITNDRLVVEIVDGAGAVKARGTAHFDAFTGGGAK